jgi:signal transduction histidine kinase
MVSLIDRLLLMRLCFVLLFLGLLGAPSVRAGQPVRLPTPPDSLRAVLRAAPTTGAARAEAFLRIANAFMTPFDSAGVILYAEAAEQLAKRAGDKLGEARAIGLRGEYYRQVGDLIRAAPLLQQSEQGLVAGPRGDFANALYRLGMLYGDLGRAERAVHYYRQAYQLFGSINDPGQQAEVLNSTGLLYQYEGQNDSAAAYLFRAVRMQHRLGRRLAEAAALGNVAVMLYGQKRYAEGATFARRAYALELAEHDTVALSSTLEYLGGFALGADSLRLALNYFKKALQFSNLKQLEGAASNLYTNIAMTYERMGKPDSAIVSYRESIRRGRQLGRSNDAGQRLSALANFFWEHQQPDSAAYWAEQALLLAKDRANVSFLPRPLKVLRLIAVQKGDFARAYELLERQRRLEIDLQAKDNERLTEELRIGYESEQAEQQIRLLTQDRELANLRRQRELGAGAAVLCLLGAGGWAYRRRQQQREQALQRANQRKDLLMSIVGHDLRGLVAGFQQVGPVLRNYAGQPTSATELRGLAQEVEADAARLAALLDNLLHWARTQTGDVINQPQALAIGAAVADTLRLYRGLAAAKQIELLADIPADTPPVWADPTLLGTVLRNLLSNAVKFTPPGGRVTVAVEPTDRALTLVVTDTGPGLPLARLTSLVEPAGPLSTTGTAGEIGTGLGLAVSHAFVKLFATSELRVMNLPGAGAKFWFSLPTLSTG